MPTLVDSGGSTRIVVVEDAAAVATVTARTSTVTATSPGPQGPAGAPGASGSGLLPAIEFSYGDASPAVVATLTQITEIVAVSLQVEVPFNGTGASVALGVAGQPGSLMPAADSDVSVLAVYEFSPRVEYPAGTQILLTIVPGAGASAGAGQIVLTTTPTN